jgi:hypothetical protein
VAIDGEQARIRSHLTSTEFELRLVPAPFPSLEERRALQLLRLRDYHSAGRFPRNDFSSKQIPIFIDSDGVPCAVAYLLIEDGQGELALAIDHEFHTAFVRDMSLPRISDWVVNSGLRLEELGRIQPGYGPSVEEVPLYTASREGDLDAMRRAYSELKPGPGGGTGTTTAMLDVALTWAAISRSPAAVRWLLDKGANPNAQLDHQWSGTAGNPLQGAAMTESLPVVRTLLEGGADPTLGSLLQSRVDNSGPLRILLTAGVDPNLENSARGSMPPLHVALRVRASREVRSAHARVLLEAGADPLSLGFDGVTPLDLALLSGDPDLADAMAAQIPGAPRPDTVVPARSGTLQTFQDSYTAASSPDGMEARWLLSEAIAAGNDPVVAELLGQGTSSKAGPGSLGPLHLAALRGSTISITRLVAAGAPVEGSEAALSPLLRLLKQEPPTPDLLIRVRTLLELGASPLEQRPELDRPGRHKLVSPLSVAATRCKSTDDEMLLLLLEFAPDADSKLLRAHTRGAPKTCRDWLRRMWGDATRDSRSGTHDRQRRQRGTLTNHEKAYLSEWEIFTSAPAEDSSGPRAAPKQGKAQGSGCSCGSLAGLFFVLPLSLGGRRRRRRYLSVDSATGGTEG